MAKQPPRPPDADAPAKPTAQPAKPRRGRAGGSPGRAEAQAAAAPAPDIEKTFAARSTADANRPGAESRPDTRSTSMGSSPSEEDIRLRAYQRYLERGRAPGMEFDDWVEAEKELKRQK
jgi:hypothetical protein